MGARPREANADLVVASSPEGAHSWPSTLGGESM